MLFFKINKCSKTEIIYSLFLLFYGSLLVNSVSLVLELSKSNYYNSIKENSELISQNPIISKTYDQTSHSIFDHNEFSCTTASLLNLTFIGDLFRTVNRYVPADTIKQLKTEEYIKILETNKLAGTRFARWYYGYYLFFNEYSLSQKIFGGGFNYMEKFGKRFGVAKFDYPHNPFIDSFLYSGIIGGVAYLYFMFLVFYNYLKYLKYHRFFFVCFIVVFYFSFVSANTHFSVPIYSFLSLIPFLTKYIREKEKNLSLSDE